MWAHGADKSAPEGGEEEEEARVDERRRRRGRGEEKRFLGLGNIR
jgi:hypothetical protein